MWSGNRNRRASGLEKQKTASMEAYIEQPHSNAVEQINGRHSSDIEDQWH